MNGRPALTFPMEFPLKIMGRDTGEFHAAVAAILAEHVAPMESLQVSRQTSTQGRFVSVTVRFTAESRAQLDALYRALSGNPHVLMAL
jgi:putative lipoic acid-binding regulatory protein